MRKQRECHCVSRPVHFTDVKRKRTSNLLSTGPAHKKNHLDHTVDVPFSFYSHSLIPEKLQSLTVPWHIKERDKFNNNVATSRPRTHSHSQRTIEKKKKNSGDYLSAIPQGLAFPRKPCSHIRGSEGACGLQQISSHFPTYSVSNAHRPHSTYRLRW